MDSVDKHGKFVNNPFADATWSKLRRDWKKQKRMNLANAAFDVLANALDITLMDYKVWEKIRPVVGGVNTSPATAIQKPIRIIDSTFELVGDRIISALYEDMLPFGMRSILSPSFLFHRGLPHHQKAFAYEHQWHSMATQGIRLP